MKHEPRDTIWKPYGYSSDALVRRLSHEMGASGFQFYAESLRRMDIQPHDIVQDIGAGLGYDAYNIAGNYHPRAIFMLEPAAAALKCDPLSSFDDLFYWIEADLIRNKDETIKLLSSSQAEQTIRALSYPAEHAFSQDVTYLQPLPSTAEDNPMPDGSVTKATIIHSAYEFYDLEAALAQLNRVLAEDGLGMLITNGVNDKLVFKSILERAGVMLKNKAPRTVSSRLTSDEALEILGQHFNIVDVLPYTDDMLITEDTRYVPINSFNSYIDRFEKKIINRDRFARVREELLEKPLDEMIGRFDYALDSIDITAIYFRKK